MPSTEGINLADYKDILSTYEQDYWQSLGPDHQGVLQSIIKEIAQDKETLSEGSLKGLDKVSQLVQMSNPKVSPSWT